MYVGSLPPVSNKATFNQSFQVTNADNDTGVDLSDAELVFTIRDPNGSEMLSADQDDMTISGADNNVFTVTFTVAQMNTLCAKQYDVGCTITINDETEQFFILTLPVMDGIVA